MFPLVRLSTQSFTRLDFNTDCNINLSDYIIRNALYSISSSPHGLLRSSPHGLFRNLRSGIILEESPRPTPYFQTLKRILWKNHLCTPHTSKRRGEIFGTITWAHPLLPNSEENSLEQSPGRTPYFQALRRILWKNCLGTPHTSKL